jgi:hypothetical protein
MALIIEIANIYYTRGEMSNNGKRTSLLHLGIIYQVKLKLHVYASGTSPFCARFHFLHLLQLSYFCIRLHGKMDGDKQASLLQQSIKQD